MIARGTIEERVLALARSKAELARDLFDAGESGGAMLTPDLVAELLQPSDAPDDEILFVDYNTPDDFPTFPEAIRDTLEIARRVAQRAIHLNGGYFPVRHGALIPSFHTI